MTRLAVSLAVAMSTLLAAAPALAADYSGSDTGLRSSFSNTLDNSDADDPLSFELGVRYWYSWGAQNFSVGGNKLTENDNTQSTEAHFRIDDASTGYYAKGLAGMSFDINGTSTGGPLGQPPSVTDGRLSYAGGDIGFSWLPKDSTTKFGPFAGYMYWNDSPNMGRANFTTGSAPGDFSYDPVLNIINGPGNSEENNVEMNVLRLGLSGKANFGNYFDVSGELAAVPYAKISGDLGAYSFPTVNGPPGSTSTIQSSSTTLDGWGYGAMGELMVGYHPTSNLTFRVGGRAWYLQGRADSTYNSVTVNNDSTHSVVGSQQYISTSNPWSLFRYGLLTEMTYSF